MEGVCRSAACLGRKRSWSYLLRVGDPAPGANLSRHSRPHRSASPAGAGGARLGLLGGFSRRRGSLRAIGPVLSPWPIDRHRYCPSLPRRGFRGAGLFRLPSAPESTHAQALDVVGDDCRLTRAFGTLAYLYRGEFHPRSRLLLLTAGTDGFL